MKLAAFLYDILVKGSIIVGLSVSALTYVVINRFSFPVDYNLLLFMFFGTVFGYNFIKYLEEFKQQRGQLVAVSLQLILVLTVVSGIISGFLFVAFSEAMKKAVVLPIIITVLYTIPLVFKSLRNISGAKIFIIAFSWAYVIGYLPIVYFEHTVTMNVVLTFIQLFLFTFALMIPFEVRDLALDAVHLKTLPQRYGIVKSKRVGMIAMLLFLLLQFFIKEFDITAIIITSIIVKITILALWFTRKDMSKYYAGVFVESIPILWGVLVLLF